MVIVRLAGGLGNQLFQYAFGRALSLRHNVPLALDRYGLDRRGYDRKTTERAYALDLFTLPVRRATQSEIAPYVPLSGRYFDSFPMQFIQRVIQKISRLSNAQYIIEKDANAVDPTVLETAPPDCYVAGYWQSERYFASIQAVLRQELSFASALSGPAAIVADYIKSVEAVCVHVRRTDFLADAHQTTLTAEQIRQGVRELIRRGVKPVLFIFSDDIDWCRQQIPVNTVRVYFMTADEIGPDPGVHFQLMTCCRHFILSVSTFGWWAAWLAKKPDQLVLHPPHRRSKDWPALNWIPLSTTGIC